MADPGVEVLGDAGTGHPSRCRRAPASAVGGVGDAPVDPHGVSGQGWTCLADLVAQADHVVEAVGSRGCRRGWGGGLRGRSRGAGAAHGRPRGAAAGDGCRRWSRAPRAARGGAGGRRPSASVRCSRCTGTGPGPVVAPDAGSRPRPWRRRPPRRGRGGWRHRPAPGRPRTGRGRGGSRSRERRSWTVARRPARAAQPAQVVGDEALRRLQRGDELGRPAGPRWRAGRPPATATARRGAVVPGDR